MRNRPRIVIVGGGLAGLRAAERLRELQYDGEVLVVGEERHRPYHRPALSKQLLNAKLEPADLTLKTYADLGDCWRLRTRVSRLDPGKRVLHLHDGEELSYDGLIVATGVQARGLPGAPLHDPRVHVLRTVDDAMGIRSTLRHSKGEVVVVGTGFTGCEVAATIRELHREVTIVGRSPTLLGGVLGAEVGLAINDLHRAQGVRLALGTSPVSWGRTPDHIAVVLADGQVLTASCVILAVGSVLNTDWLYGSGIDTANGVRCDAACFVAGTDDIVAAGDVAAWPNLRVDTTARRCEHWLNAVEMGRAAAENLLAGRARAQPFAPLPRFWSEQYGMRIQGAGFPALANGNVPLTGRSRAMHKSLVSYVKEDRRIGIVAVDQPREMLRLTGKLDLELQPRPDDLPGPIPAGHKTLSGGR
jgi:NADPH-dependent 2,4-dienoyl-CoA reductase/sulfur reductase-like enzyme